MTNYTNKQIVESVRAATKALINAFYRETAVQQACNICENQGTPDICERCAIKQAVVKFKCRPEILEEIMKEE